jgi:OOP family OmpA-OmpF porin
VTAAVLVGVVGLGAAIAGQFVYVLPRVEKSIQARATTALVAAGYPKLQVFVDGRDVILNGALPSLADVDKASAVVQKVDGVRVVREVFVSLPSTAPSPKSTAKASATAKASPPAAPASGAASPSGTSSAPALPAPLDQLATLGAVVDDGAVTLVGALPSQAARTQLQTALATTYSTERIDDQISVVPGAGTFGAESFAAVVSALGTSTRAGAVTLRTGRMTVTAVTTNGGLRPAVIAAAPGAIGTDPTALTTQISVVPPTSSATVATDAQVGAQLQALLPIPFANGSSEIGAQANGLIAVAADVLKQHPSLTVQVEGHTDASGDAAANVALSRARAAAVVAALQAAGVPGRQLAAFGYGSTRPLTTGTGPAADALNRRVVFVVAGR